MGGLCRGPEYACERDWDRDMCGGLGTCCSLGAGFTLTDMALLGRYPWRGLVTKAGILGGWALLGRLRRMLPPRPRPRDLWRGSNTVIRPGNMVA